MVSTGTYSDPQAVIATVHGFSGTAATTAGQPLTVWTAPFDCRLGGMQAWAAAAGTGAGSTILDIFIYAGDGVTANSIWSAAGDRPTLATASIGSFALARPKQLVIARGMTLYVYVKTIPAGTGHAYVGFTIAIERSTN